ncbi:MAG: hypothetical protein KHZ29_09905, partial [Desulfovibrionaceae bacterium]|nr:hypothetical protein [Desulfovibrionaceae bacterium]
KESILKPPKARFRRLRSKPAFRPCGRRPFAASAKVRGKEKAGKHKNPLPEIRKGEHPLLKILEEGYGEKTCFGKLFPRTFLSKTLSTGCGA